MATKTEPTLKRAGERASGPGIAYAAYVGVDMCKDSISVALVPSGRERPSHLGETANQPAAVEKLACGLVPRHGGEVVRFFYEAGPCGYDLHRQLTGLRFDCAVVAPSRTPKAPGGRVKTDRRDACKLARQQLGAFLPRHGATGWAGGGRRRTTLGWTGSASSLSGGSGRSGSAWTPCARRAGGGVAWRGHAHGDDGALGAGRRGPLRLAAAVDGVPGPGAERKQFRAAAAPGRHHPNRQRPRAMRLDGVGLDLPVPGAAHGAPQAQGGRGFQGGQGDRPEGPAPPVRPLPAPAAVRQDFYPPMFPKPHTHFLPYVLRRVERGHAASRTLPGKEAGQP